MPYISQERVDELERVMRGSSPHDGLGHGDCTDLIDTIRELRAQLKLSAALPSSVRPRLEVMRFAQMMEMKLAENDHKGGWSGTGLRVLLSRAWDELNELRSAVLILPDHPIAPNTVAVDSVCREAADVANFMMMIADRLARFKGEWYREER